MEKKRQELIEKYNLDDGSTTDLTNLLTSIAHLFDVPMALITIVNRGKVISHVSFGFPPCLGDDPSQVCMEVINQEKQIIIDDCNSDNESALLILNKQSPNIKFYAGTPIKLEGIVIGSLCLLDEKRHLISAEKIEALTQFSYFISQHMQLQKEHYQLKNEHSLLDHSLAVLISWRYKNGLTLQSITKNVEDVLGIDYQPLISHEVSFETCLTGDSQEDFHFMLQNHLNGVETTEIQLEIKHLKKNVWVRLLSKAFFNEQGQLISVQAIATDNTEQRYFENRLNETNKQMRLLLEASELGTWDYDLATDQTKVNRRWCDIIGVDYEFYDGSSRFWRQRIHPADLNRVQLSIEDHLKGKTPAYESSYRMKHENGGWVWIETYGRVVERDAQGRALRLAGTHRDINTRKLAEIHQMKQSQLLAFMNKARAAYLKDNDLPNACQQILPELIDIADSQFAFIGQVLYEEGRKRLFIHAISELSWNSASEALVELYKGRKLYFDSFDNLFGEVIKTGQTVISNQLGNHHASVGTPSGHPPIYRFIGLPIELQGELVGMVGLANKFTNYTQEDAQFLKPLLDALGGLYYAIELEKARSAAEDQLVKMAMTDSLSGLNNRRAFKEYSHKLSTDTSAYLAMIDIDHFKKVNDQYGHDMGDLVIRKVASLMRDTLSEQHYLARVGGEEFAVILKNENAEQTLAELDMLRNKVSNTLIEEGEHPFSISISIGFAKFLGDVNKALIQADSALYVAKENGRNQVIQYHEK